MSYVIYMFTNCVNVIMITVSYYSTISECFVQSIHSQRVSRIALYLLLMKHRCMKMQNLKKKNVQIILAIPFNRKFRTQYVVHTFTCLSIITEIHWINLIWSLTSIRTYVDFRDRLYTHVLHTRTFLIHRVTIEILSQSWPQLRPSMRRGWLIRVTAFHTAPVL